MPLARYFSIVGGVLLALLFILDASLPKLPVAARPEVYPPVIRIHTDWKWPERIVYNTNLPTIVPTSIGTADIVAPASEKIVDASASTSERQAFAMLPSSAERSQAPNAKKQVLKPRYHRKFARARAPAPRVAMARHLQFGWFGRNFW